MNKSSSMMIAVACLGLFGGGAALASQSASTHGKNREQITVQAPHQIKHKDLMLGRGMQDSLSESVSYADLDLRTPPGAQELQTRIQTAANAVCAELETADPSGTPPKDVCARLAANKAMIAARAAIDHARANG